MAKKLGKNCKAYRNSGSYGSPSWQLVSTIKDLMLKGGKKEADATTRGDAGNEITVGTIKQRSIEFEIVEDTTTGEYTTFSDSYENGTGIDMVILNGLINASGATGVRMTVEVMDFDRDEKLDGVVTRKVTAKPTISDNYPVVYTV